MKKEEELKFKGKILRCIYNSEDFKTYAVEVDKNKFPNIKFSKYGSATIVGNLHELGLGQSYEIVATEQNTKYGYSYKVVNIRKDKPMSENDIYIFLQEILTLNQASELWRVYPDIVDRVVNGNTDDIDFSKLKGIGEKTFESIKSKIIENYALCDLVAEFNGVLTISMLKKLYDKYPSIQQLKNKLKSDPYKCLCGLSRVGFITADNLLLELEKTEKIKFDYDLRISKQRCLSCVLYLLEKNEEEGNTKMDLRELRKQVIKLVPNCANHYVECLKEDCIYYNKDNFDIALMSTYNTEKYIATEIINGLKNPRVWNFNWKNYKTKGEYELSDEQLELLHLACSENIFILEGAAGCVDCDTEFFNGYEWKKISEYKKGDKVLQYNKDGSAQLVEPLKYIKQPSEMLYHFETKYGLDQTLSLNHNVYYITSKGNLYNKPFNEIKKDQENSGFHGKFITSFNYSGKGIKLTDDEIRLTLAIFADGHFADYALIPSKPMYGKVRVNLKKERKKERLEKILNSLKLEYEKKESSADGYHCYYFYPPIIGKHFSNEWYNCSKHQLEIIADEVMNWDGRYNTQNDYTTTCKKDADFIQFVFTSLGYRTTISTHNRVGKEYTTNGNIYIRKSKEYLVRYTIRTLIGMCHDKKLKHSNTVISEYKPKDGYEYCFTVPSHMLVLRRNDKIFITGNCGKSASTEMLIQMFKDNNITYKLMTPTGKSAKVLADFTHEDATTIHRGLLYNPTQGWGYNKDQKLDVDVVLVDEFSMVGLSLMERLIDAIDFNRTKLILIGDPNQLPSIECGNLMHDFLTSKIIPKATLTKVFRYGSNGLLTVATDIRQGREFIDKNVGKFTAIGDKKDYAFVRTSDETIVKETVALYEKLITTGYNGKIYNSSDIALLTAYNKSDYGAVALNKQLQKIANKNYGSSNKFNIGETIYYKNDIVMEKVNNYKAELFIDDNWRCDEENKENTTFIANGETGIVKEVSSQYIIFDFDGVKVKYYRNDMNGVGLGYSYTFHKSQGSSIKAVIMITPKAHTYFLNSNLLYVGVTRSIDCCFHLGNVNTVLAAIHKKANLVRRTFMFEFLTNIKLTN